MIMYLRNKNNDTLLDVDCYIKDDYVELGSVVCIEPYSKFLLDSPEEKRTDIISDFDFLQELRGWLWESYFMGRKNTSNEYNGVIKELRSTIKRIADKYDLYYVED